MRANATVAGWACLFVLAGCGKSSSEHVPLPPVDASPAVVLKTYLHAVKAGDCSTARALAASTFTVGNGDLCGEVDLKDFVVDERSAWTGQEEVEYSAELTTSGSKDRSVPSGKITWFYALKRQDGQWRLFSGGSGP